MTYQPRLILPLVFLLAAPVLALAGRAAAATTTLIPTSDTYVSKNSPDASYGKETTTRVDNGDVSPGDASLIGYMRFDLRAQLAAPSSAKLRLYVVNPSAEKQNLKTVDISSWTETMTYNTRPPMGTLITTTPGNNATGWLELDVTSYVVNKLGQQISFGMDQAGIDGFAFTSREDSNKPQLVLTVASTSSTTTTPSSTTTTTLPSTSTPPLWKATHDAGNLNEWSLNGGGGLYNSGSSESVASADVARSGGYGLRARIWTPSTPTSGVRAFRWAEARAHRGLYYSVWAYIPNQYTLTGSPCCGQFWNAFQFKTRTTDGSRVDPVWAFYATPDGRGGLYLRAGWGWGGTQLAGPYASDGLSGKFYEPITRAPLPVGRWVHLEAFLQEANGFDGRLTFWQDGTKLFDFVNVRTSYANCNFNSWCADNEWSVNLYSDGMTPNPATIYIDDAAIATSFIP